jgi:DNA polymerase III epsilon subunit-like protein
MRHNLQSILGSQCMSIPASYVVVDLETTGLSFGNDRIWQYGVYPVKDGQPLYEQGNSVWLQTDRQFLQAADFEISRRGDAYRSVEASGIVKDAAFDRAQSEFVQEVNDKGVDRQKGMQILLELLSAYAADGYPLVGQNFVRFDAKFLAWESKRLELDFEFPDTLIIDVGLLIKAARLNRKKASHETSKQFYVRVSEQRAKGIYYALERFCIPHWHLDKKYGVDTSQAHDAGYDTWITNLVLHEIMLEAFPA